MHTGMNTDFFRNVCPCSWKKSTSWCDEKPERDSDHCSWMDLYQDLVQ